MTSDRRQVSVIIPVYNDKGNLSLCLASLRASDEAPLEYIVVDDGSTDGSAEVAAEMGAKVLSTGGRKGPACARNIGAKAAKGDVLLFIDADVCVNPNVVQSVLAEFDMDPELDALMGSYDSTPAVSHFVSQYRNLLHHHGHQLSRGRASTFWAGCGAIRKSVFLEFGGFDEMYNAPAIEDIELGSRLARAGRKVILCPEIQAKHLKKWTIRNMLRTDFMYRALPWTELTLRNREIPDSLNLRISQRISVALVFMVVLQAAILTFIWHVYFLVPFFAMFFIALSGYWMGGWTHKSKLLAWIMGAALTSIAGVSVAFHMWGIAPLIAVAALALFARHRYLYSSRSRRKWTGLWVGGYSLMAAVLVWIYFPWKPMVVLLFLTLLALIALNQQFYVLLAAERGKFFALAAIPFHCLYFLSCGVAFMLASIKYPFEKVFGSSPARKSGPEKEPAAKATVL